MISQYMTLNFGGKSSADVDLNIEVVMGTGGNAIFSDTFVSNKTVNEDQIPYRPIPYFRFVTRQPLEIPLILAREDRVTQEQLQLIKQWLDYNDYREFYFEEYPIRHYFGIMVDTSTIHHNGLGEGYITATMRCNAPYAFSPEISNYYHIPAEGEYIELDNRGDEHLFPFIQFTKINDGPISIMNLTNGGKQCIIDNIKDGETITLDSYNQTIDSDIPFTFHADDHNDVFVECPVGRNRLFINGECRMKWYYRYVYK